MEKVSKEELIGYLTELHPDAKCALDYKNDYQLITAIILSAQTTDVSVNKVTPTLFSKYPTIKDMASAKMEDVENIIRSIGLYKNKAKNLINTMMRLDEDGFDHIPNDYNYLISLPGVGNKTANVFLAEYYNENTLGVDTHILRISKRLRIIKEDADVVDAERNLKKIIKDYPTKKFHHMMIQFGRNECTARNPKCSLCKLENKCRYKAS